MVKKDTILEVVRHEAVRTAFIIGLTWSIFWIIATPNIAQDRALQDIEQEIFYVQDDMAELKSDFAELHKLVIQYITQPKIN